MYLLLPLNAMACGQGGQGRAGRQAGLGRYIVG